MEVTVAELKGKSLSRDMLRGVGGCLGGGEGTIQTNVVSLGRASPAMTTTAQQNTFSTTKSKPAFQTLRSVNNRPRGYRVYSRGVPARAVLRFPRDEGRPHRGHVPASAAYLPAQEELRRVSVDNLTVGPTGLYLRQPAPPRGQFVWCPCVVFLGRTTVPPLLPGAVFLFFSLFFLVFFFFFFVCSFRLQSRRINNQIGHVVEGGCFGGRKRGCGERWTECIPRDALAPCTRTCGRAPCVLVKGSSTCKNKARRNGVDVGGVGDVFHCTQKSPPFFFLRSPTPVCFLCDRYTYLCMYPAC